MQQPRLRGVPQIRGAACASRVVTERDSDRSRGAHVIPPAHRQTILSKSPRPTRSTVCRPKNRSAARKNPANRFSRELFRLLGPDESVETIRYADDAPAVFQPRRAYHCPNNSIQSGAVTSACADANRSFWCSHSERISDRNVRFYTIGRAHRRTASRPSFHIF